MEEDTIDLIDYCRVVWKRKILIIAVMSIGLAVGIGLAIANLRLKPKTKVTYSAEVIIKVGKKLSIAPFTGVATSVDYIESPANLEAIIPFVYYSKVSGNPGYHLAVEKVGSLGMLRMSMKGHDTGVEGALRKLSDELIEEHREIAEVSLVRFKDIIEKLEEHAVKIKNKIDEIQASVREIRSKEEKYLKFIDRNKGEEVLEYKQSAISDMLYLRIIEKEKELSQRREELREIQMKILTHRFTLGNVKEYKTEMSQEINIMSTPVKQRTKSTKNIIVVAGVVSLIISLFVVFIMENLNESKSRRKGK